MAKDDSYPISTGWPISGRPRSSNLDRIFLRLRGGACVSRRGPVGHATYETANHGTGGGDVHAHAQ